MAETELLDVRRCGQESPISLYTWREWIRQGRIPHVRLGRRVFITRQDFEAFLVAGRVEARPGANGR